MPAFISSCVFCVEDDEAVTELVELLDNKLELVVGAFGGNASFPVPMWRALRGMASIEVGVSVCVS